MQLTTPGGETQALRRTRPGLRLPWVLVVLVGLIGAVSAAVAAFACFADLAGPGTSGSPAVDLCGLPLTGFWDFWAQYGWLCLGALAVLLGGGALALPIVMAYGKRLLAAGLIVVTLGLSPLPWVVQLSRQSYAAGCHVL